MSIARVSPVLLPGYRWAYPELRKGCELALHGVRGNTGKRWFDDSGFDRHGLLINMDPPTAWGLGDSRSGGGALEFDQALSTEVDFPLNFTPVSPITLAARFKPLSVTGAHAIITISDASVNRYLAILTVNDDVRAQASGDVAPDQSAELSTVLMLDEWYTLVGVFESETIRTVYLNGASQSATQIADIGPFSGLDTMKLGVLYINDVQVWQAKLEISHVGIWSRALVPSEIQLLHDRPDARLEQRRQMFPSRTTPLKGPYCVTAAGVYHTGAEAGGLYHTGAAAGATFVTGHEAGQAHG